MNRLAGALATALAVVALLVAGLAWRAVSLHPPTAPDVLTAAAALLDEQQAAIEALRAAPFAESGKGMLDAYLVRLRRDGAAGTADMKQRLDALAQNTTALMTLLDLAAQQARTAAFRTEAGKFRVYAIAWRDRWNSATELFMAGGSFAAAEVPLPSGLHAALQAELRAVR